MLGSIKYNLAHLLDFRGRDARQTFWYYVLFVYLLNIGVSLIAIIPGLMRAMSAVMAAPQQSPEAAELAAQGMMTSMAPGMMWASLIGGVLLLTMLAASLVRRLHDSDLSGWWATLPGAIYAYTLARMPTQMEEMQSVLSEASTGEGVSANAMQGQFQLETLIGWLPFLMVIILGVRKSSAGPNRYGEAPVRF